MNKFLVDDKGVLILIMFGLPPVYHLDDALRGSNIQLIQLQLVSEHPYLSIECGLS